MKIFIDMDGVLCDWVAKFEQIFPDITYDDFKVLDQEIQSLYMCNMCSPGTTHYEYLKPLKDTVGYLTDFIQKNSGHQYFILTSVGRHNPHHVVRQKLLWLKKYFPIIDIAQNFRYVHDSRDKALYASEDAIIIDDYKLVLDVFKKAGGYSISGVRTDNIQKKIEEYTKNSLLLRSIIIE